MSWCDLPNDLLSAIFKILTNNVCYSPDLYQCLHVCTSWRCMANKLLHTTAVPTPWLLIPRQKPDKLVFDTSLYNSHNKTTGIAFDDSSTSILSLELPIQKHQSCFTQHNIIAFASHRGWLLLGTRFEHPVFLYNPLSRVVIKLPPLPLHLHLDECAQFVMSETSPRDPRCIVSVLLNTRVLAFCKPSEGCSSSSLWVLSEKPDSSKFYVVSMIFHKGIFYTMDDDCALYVHHGITDLIINDSSGMSSRTWPWPVLENKVALSTYSNKEYLLDYLIQLVESKHGELLMIERIFEDSQTKSFNVYMLTIRGSYKKKNWGSDKNNCEYYWKDVNRLEENEALYVGWNDCVSISVNNSDGNTYKPNCIHYFHEVDDQLCGYGVYNLESRSIQHWVDDDIDSEEYDSETDAGPSCCRLFAPSIP